MLLLIAIASSLWLDRIRPQAERYTSRRRVLRIEKCLPLILLVETGVRYFPICSRLSHDQHICLGMSSCKRVVL
jgi:hypothetical protein